MMVNKIGLAAIIAGTAVVSALVGVGGTVLVENYERRQAAPFVQMMQRPLPASYQALEDLFEQGSYQTLQDIRKQDGYDLLPTIQSQADFDAAKQEFTAFDKMEDKYGLPMGFGRHMYFMP
jgi:hypothetical protein